MATLLTFGKHKNELLETAPAGYVRWLAAHKNVLSVEHRHFSDKAKELLERREQEAQATARAADKLDHMEAMAKGGSFLAEMDLAMTNFIVAATPKYPTNKHGISDISQAGNLNGNKAFSILR